MTEQQLHRRALKHPFHTITVILVILALVQSVVLLTHHRPVPAPASSPSQPVTPTQVSVKALLTALHKLGPLRYQSPNQRTVTDERSLNGSTIELKTTGYVDADIDLATLPDADVAVRSASVVTVTLPGITMTADVRAQQYRVLGTTAWADVTPQVTGVNQGLAQFARDGMTQLTNDTECLAAYWAQQVVAQHTAGAGFPAVIIQLRTFC